MMRSQSASDVRSSRRSSEPARGTLRQQSTPQRRSAADLRRAAQGAAAGAGAPPRTQLLYRAIAGGFRRIGNAFGSLFGLRRRGPVSGRASSERRSPFTRPPAEAPRADYEPDLSEPALSSSIMGTPAASAPSAYHNADASASEASRPLSAVFSPAGIVPFVRRTASVVFPTSDPRTASSLSDPDPSSLATFGSDPPQPSSRPLSDSGNAAVAGLHDNPVLARAAGARGASVAATGSPAPGSRVLPEVLRSMAGGAYRTGTSAILPTRGGRRGRKARGGKAAPSFGGAKGCGEIFMDERDMNRLAAQRLASGGGEEGADKEGSEEEEVT